MPPLVKGPEAPVPLLAFIVLLLFAAAPPYHTCSLSVLSTCRSTRTEQHPHQIDACLQELKVRALRLAFDTWEDPNISENFKSERNDGLNGLTVDVLAGKTLGGTSSINVAQWTIPNYEVQPLAIRPVSKVAWM